MIVVAWILALLAALPLAPMVTKAVNYNIDASGVNDLPSEVAQRYINENFGGSTAQGSSTIILLKNTDGSIFEDSIKYSIENMTERIQKAKTDGKINANVTITSLYSSIYLYTQVYIDQIGPLYSAADNYSVALPLMLFEVPLLYWDSFNNTEDALLIVYDLPQHYYDNWLAENQTGRTITQIDSYAYNDTRLWVQDVISHRTSLNSTEEELLWLYLDDFTNAWNSTSADPLFNLHPADRLEEAMESSYPLFRDQVMQRLHIISLIYIELAHANFSLNDYQDFHRISQYNEVAFDSMLEIVLDQVPTEIKDDVLLYYGTFYNLWNGSASAPSVTQFRSYGDQAANVTSDAAGSPVKELIDVFYFQLGWERRLDLATIRSLTLTFLSNYTSTQPWLVQEIIDLGDNPNSTEVDALAAKLVQNSTVDEYPLPMLPLIPLMLVDDGNDSTIIMIGYSVDGKYTSGTGYVSLIRQIVGEELSAQPNVEHYVTGLDPMTYDQEAALSKDLEIVDPVAIILILILIGLFFNSLLAAALPPSVIGMGLGISFAAVYLIATYVFSVNFLVITLMITASLGAGCDYCIFMLSRYREERRAGKEKDEAVQEAVTWAGETVATSGATVMIGFGSLFLASLDTIKSFGTMVIGIVLALMISLTLVPALLHIFGDKLFWPSKGIKPQSQLGQRYFKHAAHNSIKHAKVLLVAAIVISIPAVYVMATTPTSFDLIESMPDSESKSGIETMEATFGGGMIQPTSIGLQMSGSLYNADGSWNITMLNAVEAMSKRLGNISGVSMLLSATRPYGQTVDYANLSHEYTVQAAACLAVMQRMVGEGNDSALVLIVFQEDPFTAHTIDSIKEIRSIANTVNDQQPDITAAYVGGGTATIYDVATTTTSDFLNIIAIAMLLIYIVLLLVLGSVLNPLRSLLTILLSISWTVAITAIVFEMWMGMHLNFLVPLILIVVCLGLGMDYDVLLSTRIREEVHKGMTTNEAIEHSMLQTGGIITACGVIMASAFGSLLLTGNPMLMQFGMALMIAIVLDAVVVRTYLVPAIMSLMGKWNWWAPKRLQRGGQKKE
ncbi:MAG: preprotein translocase subunit SecD [Methanomassiliicoccales archaeon PtaU1.Bin124]|nr:MAG: preprotein translocase subunit SecD [Methanomassiliicoccales archaeon PtaU1.Bin124]